LNERLESLPIRTESRPAGIARKAQAGAFRDRPLRCKFHFLSFLQRGIASRILPIALAVPSPFSLANDDLIKTAREDRVFTADFIQTLASEPTATINESHDDEGRTMLHWLASRSHQARMLAVLLYKADVNVKDGHGRTPLFDNLEAHDPFWNGDADFMILEMLTVCGADLNARADDGMTPLALAVKNSDHRKAAFLIEHGAAVNPKDVPPEMAPAAIAQANGDQRMISLLEDKTGDVDPTEAETQNTTHPDPLLSSNLQAVKKMIKSGWDMNAQDEKGRTPLFRAVEEKRADLANLLVSAGADPNIATHAGMTPLMASL
jgi:ankyrin repeat protein